MWPYSCFFSFSSWERFWFFSRAFLKVCPYSPDDVLVINFETLLYIWKKNYKSNLQKNIDLKNDPLDDLEKSPFKF